VRGVVCLWGGGSGVTTNSDTSAVASPTTPPPLQRGRPTSTLRATRGGAATRRCRRRTR
jgi:hypothetical protein